MPAFACGVAEVDIVRCHISCHATSSPNATALSHPETNVNCCLQAMAPPEHTATASTSTLCKLLAWDGQQLWQRAAAEGRTPLIAHQADWLAALLHGQPGASDWWVGWAGGAIFCLQG